MLPPSRVLLAVSRASIPTHLRPVPTQVVLFSSPLLLAQLYRDHRDAILALFWENPERDLTFAEVRQHIDGEVNGLMR